MERPIWFQIPQDKREKALMMVRSTIRKRKIRIKDIQKLMGTLNFLNRALIPGHTFTRRIYAKLTEIKDGAKRVLKSPHHVALDSEFLGDCRMWEQFLKKSDQIVLCRPFLDILGDETAKTLHFYMDASGSQVKGGFSAFFSGRWIFGIWSSALMAQKPSIEFLELYALCLGVFTWAEFLTNTRIKIFCDNKSVWDMVNSSSSKCPRCMKLLRLLVLNNLIFNRKIFMEYIPSKENTLADALSRQDFKTFWDKALAYMAPNPDVISKESWPEHKAWEF